MEKRTIRMLAPLFLVMIIAVAVSAGDKPSTSKNPTKRQQEFRDWKFGMFLHFNMATFFPVEWASGYEDPGKFTPDKLDCSQWAKTAKSIGMRYAVLTVKHTGGWCLWDSAATTHDIAQFKNYKNGKGDIVKEFVDAFRKEGLKVGFYYCFPNNFTDPAQNNVPPEGKPDLHGLPPEAQNDYVGFIKKQLKELLTNYGPIDLIWIDQYSNKYTYPKWQEIKSYIKKIQPNCLVIGNNSHDPKDSDAYSVEVPATPDKYPPKGKPMPGEVCDKISSVWFWNTDTMQSVRKPEEMAKMLKICRERDTNLLLNVPPDRHGLISGAHLQAVKNFREYLNKDKDLAKYLGVGAEK
jgi:alpha-L-fucosidase